MDFLEVAQQQPVKLKPRVPATEPLLLLVPVLLQYVVPETNRCGAILHGPVTVLHVVAANRQQCHEQTMRPRSVETSMTANDKLLVNMFLHCVVKMVHLRNAP